MGPVVLDRLPTTPTVVAMFESLPGEPETGSWRRAAGERGWRVAVPEVVGETMEWRTGDGDRAEAGELAAIVVPGVAFTLDGARLGRGGGHYDRLLAANETRRDPAVTVGVCLVEFVVESLPIEPHDRRVDGVITG